MITRHGMLPRTNSEPAVCASELMQSSIRIGIGFPQHERKHVGAAREG
jgi:hypothetical protein